MQIIRPITIDDTALVSSSVPENATIDYAAWAIGTTYADGARVRVVSTNIHRVYESVQSSNTGHDPLADTTSTWWLLVGATNRWRMFDGVVNNPTTADDEIEVVIQATGRVNSVALLNISADEAQIVMEDATQGVVYDQTYSLKSDAGITDWYSWYFEEITRFHDFAVTDLPAYSNATITITLTGDGELSCGECVIGKAREIGDAEAGASVAIQDYSIKEADSFGSFEVVERAYSKRATFKVWLDYSFTDELVSLLASYRATPIVYLGAENFRSTLIFGFYKDFSVEITYPDQKSVCTLEIEGLT